MQSAHPLCVNCVKVIGTIVFCVSFVFITSLLEMQKTCFFQTMFFMQKKSVFYRKKQFFNVFFVFSITGRFLINYSAIRVYL